MKKILILLVFLVPATTYAQNQLVEIFADSLFSSEIIDQTSVATGAPLLISEGVYGGQSFIVDTTGFLTRIEITAKKSGASISNLSLEIKTGSDPSMGSSLITEPFEVLSASDSIYTVFLTTPIPVTKGDALVMIVQKTGGGNAEWQRSSTDVYSGGTTFLYASGWLPPLSNQDHWFSSYVEVTDSSLVFYFSVADDGLIKVKNRITNVTDPISPQDAATKAYVDLLEARLALLTVAPVAEDDSLVIPETIIPYNIDVLDLGTPDNDPDGAFRYGNFIEITNVGSSPGSSNNLSKKGRALSISNNDTAEDKTDDYVTYTPVTLEIDTFYYVITDLDGLKDTALVEITVFKTVQQRLDSGETPIEIYNSDNSLLDSLYGKTYQGGLIFYLNTTTGEGLVSAPVDQSTGTDWGCDGDLIGGTSSAIGTGQANTDTIVNFCAETGIAARLCDDLVFGGYEDWFLPSKDELNLMWQNLADSDGGGDNDGASDPNNIGGFSSDDYWSSTEYNLYSAWRQGFNNGNQVFNNKNFNYIVRAVRTF